MGFEQSPLGDGSATGSGNVTTSVNNHYGARVSEGAQGNIKTEGVVNELSIEFSAADVGAGALPLLSPILPIGSIIEDVYFKTKTLAALGGTTPTILVGTDGSEVTNGVVVSEAQAEDSTPGTYDITGTLTGTWASPLAAATTVGIALGGTSPTIGSAGLFEVVIRYTDIRS